MTDWKTYKSQTPFQFIVAPSESYNEGNKIAFSPKIPGKSPVWGMDRSGIPITPTHTPCRYWTGEGWEWKSWSERICMGLQIDYDSALMYAGEQQLLRVKDANGDIVDVDIVVWFLTGVGSINAEIGSSITYTAPSEPLGTDTAVIEMWCNGEVKDTLTITFPGKITYTTPQQPPGTTQDLPIDNPNPACEYTWELVGGGSLNLVNGVMKYTAPTTNPNCENNATISLLCNGVVISTVRIAINTYTGPSVAFLDYWGYYRIELPGGYPCGRTIYSEGQWGGCCRYEVPCTGVYPRNSSIVCGCSGCTDKQAHEFCDPNPVCVVRIDDKRTEAMKAAGCCPAALI